MIDTPFAKSKFVMHNCYKIHSIVENDKNGGVILTVQKKNFSFRYVISSG